MRAWLKKHREVLAYLVFGVLTTLLNILLYAVFSDLFGYKAANSWGNVLDNILCILFAYATNRAFVFASKTHGREGIVLETDSPYLTPVPNRGKRNESAYVKVTLIKVAGIYGKSPEKVAQITSDNTLKVFGMLK